MSSNSDIVQKYRELADWLGVYWERLVLAVLGWVFALAVITSMGYRLAWQQGWSEPQTRAGYAVVEALGSLGSWILLGALLTIAYATYRRWTGSVEYETPEDAL